MRALLCAFGSPFHPGDPAHSGQRGGSQRGSWNRLRMCRRLLRHARILSCKRSPYLMPWSQAHDSTAFGRASGLYPSHAHGKSHSPVERSPCRTSVECTITYITPLFKSKKLVSRTRPFTGTEPHVLTSHMFWRSSRKTNTLDRSPSENHTEMYRKFIRGNEFGPLRNALE